MEPSAQFKVDLANIGYDPHQMGEAALRELGRHGMLPDGKIDLSHLAVRIGVAAVEYRENHREFMRRIFEL